MLAMVVRRSSTDDQRTHGSLQACSKQALIQWSGCRDDARFTKVTHNQGFIEGLLVDALLAGGLAIDRPARPTSMEISQDESELRDPTAYPLKVCSRDRSTASPHSSLCRL